MSGAKVLETATVEGHDLPAVLAGGCEAIAEAVLQVARSGTPFMIAFKLSHGSIGKNGHQGLLDQGFGLTLLELPGDTGDDL